MQWPGTPDNREKIPTIVALEGDNENKVTAWGASVSSTMSSSSWFKLGMASKSSGTPEDDPLLQQAIGKGLMRIPKGETPQSLCKRFLACLWRHIMQVVGKRYPGLIDITPIEFVFSAPAEWGESYKNRLTAAAKAAGFLTRPQDSITTVDEPEAAALLTFECYKEMEQVKSMFQVWHLSDCK